MSLRTLELQGNDAVKIAEAISSETRFRVIQLLSTEKLDISTIARRLQVSEAHVSEEITLLEKLGIIKTSYERGKRGIRKVCELAVGKIIINLKQEDASRAQQTP